MTQIPILNGIYTDENSDFRVSYPHNLVPVPVEHGISKGYLRPADGIVALGDPGPGICRGGINWNGVCYRVMGNSLVKVSADGTISSSYGTIVGTGPVTMDYSFDYLSISGGGAMYLFNGAALAQITDVDLGTSIDHIWVDGYFMSTDGVNLVVTELADPFSVLPTKYGSSEADPDPVLAILKLRNEPYAVNRYTIEVFDNIGGNNFPFQRIEGAQINRGAIGTHACCLYLDNIAFVGGGRTQNGPEGISVWLASSAGSVRIATREIDDILATYTDEVLSEILIEARVHSGHQHLLIHLPDKTLVYDGAASEVIGQPVWFTLGSAATPDGEYRARHFVRVYNQWSVADSQSGQLGFISRALSSQWGSHVAWQFGTVILYNKGYGALVHELELVSLTGRAVLDDDPTIQTQYSSDGETWSMPRFISAGKRGERTKRLVWLQQGPLRHWRIQRFQGDSRAHMSMARLEARLEALSV